jgi:hypothetical protein
LNRLAQDCQASSVNGPFGSDLLTSELTDLGSSKELCVILPPLDEQRQVVALLASETTKLDALVAKTQRSIERLQE